MSVVIYSFNVTQSCTNKITQNTSIIELWTNINVSIEVVDDNGVSSIVNLISILNSQANLLPQVPGTFSSDKTVNEGDSNVISLSYDTRQSVLQTIISQIVLYTVYQLIIILDIITVIIIVTRSVYLVLLMLIEKLLILFRHSNNN